VEHLEGPQKSPIKVQGDDDLSKEIELFLVRLAKESNELQWQLADKTIEVFDKVRHGRTVYNSKASRSIHFPPSSIFYYFTFALMICDFVSLLELDPLVYTVASFAQTARLTTFMGLPSAFFAFSWNANLETVLLSGLLGT